MKTSGIRTTLKLGSVVFGGSAVFLVVFPGIFLDWLGLERSEGLLWSMRMIGITVFALAGNMWNNAAHDSNVRVRNVAVVMCVSAGGLGALTLAAPGGITWFGYLYAAIGFGFSVSYLVNLARLRR